MRKSFAPLLLLPLLLLGCNPGGGPEKIAPIYGKYVTAEEPFETQIEPIDLIELNTMVVGEKDFALLVYDPDSTCSCWGKFQGVISPYLEESQVLLYAITIDEMAGAADNFGLTLTSDASIGLFKDGELLYEKISKTGDPWSEDPSAFAAWMDERIQPSPFLKVGLSEVGSFFEADDPFLLMFGRSSCGDCAYVEERVLSDLGFTPKRPAYYLDCDEVGIRYDENGDYDEAAWTAFKDAYGLSEKESPLGYGLGYVPSWVYYDPGDPSFLGEGDYHHAAKDMCVYLNDQVASDEDGYYIASSFYEEERIGRLTWLMDSSDPIADREELLNGALDYVGSRLEEDDLVQGQLKQEAAAAFHDPLLKAFLAYYLG